MKEIKDKGFSTKAIHGGNERNEHGTLATPIYQSSTFVFENAEQGGRRFQLEEDGYIYTRLGNPTVSILEKKVALLEGANGCIAASSGIGAITTAMWTVLKKGDHVVADYNLYGCTFAFFTHGLSKFDVEVTYVDASNPQNVKNAIKGNTRAIYCETPTNPSLKLIDLEQVGKIAKEHNVYFIVDNTFATPYNQNPMEYGADIIIHSGTKYLNGHGDVIAGFICANDKELLTNLRYVGIKDMTGSVMSPFDAFLIIRGLKTLELRMEKHCENAQTVAYFLEAHPKVEKVLYPGLQSHPQYELAKKQMKLPGGIITFTLKGGIEEGKKFINSTKLCRLAVSLGDAETLIQHPASMTHSPLTKEERLAAGIGEADIRISLGLENVEDIIEDLRTAFESI